MNSFDPADQFVLQTARHVVEACRLPAGVKADFREWVLVGLFVRGRDAISDYFFAVLNEEGVEDIDDDVETFSVFLAYEFHRYLEGPGSKHRHLFVRSKTVAAAVPEKQQPHIPSQYGPSLPPAMVDTLIAAGFDLSGFELGSPWDLPPVPVTVDSPVDANEELTEADSHVASERVVLPAVWRSARVRFKTAAILSFVEHGDGRPPALRDKGRTLRELHGKPPPYRDKAGLFGHVKQRPPALRDKAPALLAGRHAAAELGGGVTVARRKPPEGGRDSGFEAIGAGSGGSVCGMAALVADTWQERARRDIGSSPSFDVLSTWLTQNRGGAYIGNVDFMASYKSANGGPYPDRFFVRRSQKGLLTVSGLLGNWRGKVAVLDDGFPLGVPKLGDI